MEILEFVMFWVLAVMLISFSILSVTSRRTIYSVIFAIFVFWSAAALYFLLNAQFNATVQVAIYGVGVAILLIFSVMLSSNCKQKISLRPRVFWALAIALLLFGSILFYISNSIGGENFYLTQNFSLQSLGVEMLVKNFFPFELVSILLLTAIVGVGAVSFVKRNKIKESEAKK